MNQFKKQFNLSLENDSNENVEAYYFLKKKLCYIGNVEPFGSATHCKAFRRKHDYDVGVITEIRDKDLLEIICIEVIQEWIRFEKTLPLHIILIGDFDSDFKTKEFQDIKYIIQFVNRKVRYLLWLRTLWEKFVQYQSKKLLRYKKIIFSKG